MARRARFRSDKLREVYQAAVSQGFKPGERGSNHVSLACPHPGCNHVEVLSKTGRAHEHEIKDKISRLCKHALVWQGKGGQHVG